MLSIFTFGHVLPASLQDAEMYALGKDTPLFGGAYEISRGFVSFFTPDEYIQNILSIIFSPISIILFIALAAYILYYILRSYDRRYRSSIAEGQQLLLFKARQAGLSSYQFKILRGITDFLHLERPSLIADDPHLFERSIPRFLQYVISMGEKGESVVAICRDLVITYEKMYHRSSIRKPLSLLSDCELNTLLVISKSDGTHYIAKIKSYTQEDVVLHVFARPLQLQAIVPGADIKGMLWRSGDAEYDFSSVVISISGNEMEILLPREIVRGNPVTHPLVDIVMPCTLTIIGSQGESEGTIESDIFKLNETEALIRTRSPLDRTKTYSIGFMLSDFAIQSTALLMSERYITDRHAYYYNVRFSAISDAAKTVIGNYLVRHMFS
jgi:hypothetical protein